MRISTTVRWTAASVRGQARKASRFPGRAWLVAEAAKFGAKFMLNPPRPPHWGGYRLIPDRWEFWQGA